MPATEALAVLGMALCYSSPRRPQYSFRPLFLASTAIFVPSPFPRRSRWCWTTAAYQRNAVVQALASQLGITLLYLPSYSPNLNLIERLWKFIKRRAVYGRYHATFAEFQAAIQQTLDGLSASVQNSNTTQSILL